MTAPSCRFVAPSCYTRIEEDDCWIHEGLNRVMRALGQSFHKETPLDNLHAESERLLTHIHPRHPDWHLFIPRWPAFRETNIYHYPAQTVPCARHNVRCFKRFYVMMFFHMQQPPAADRERWMQRLQGFLAPLFCSSPAWSFEEPNCYWPVPRDVSQLQAQGLFYLVNLATAVVIAGLVRNDAARHTLLCKFADVSPRVFMLLDTGDDPVLPPPAYSARGPPPPTYSLVDEGSG